MLWRPSIWDYDAYLIRLEKDDGDTAYNAMDVVILKDSSLIVDRKMYAKESPLVMVKHVYLDRLGTGGRISYSHNHH